MRLIWCSCIARSHFSRFSPSRHVTGSKLMNFWIVLLGSIATPKYVDPLLEIFGERLLFPAEFAGRGDMSRGGLMLRCVSAGVQLTYVPLASAARHGPKPPKLAALARRRLNSPNHRPPGAGVDHAF